MIESDVSNFTVPVHLSLMKPDRIFGIGTTALGTILCITILLVNFVHWIFLFFGVIALITINLLCKKDPFLFDILIDSLFQLDDYTA